MLALYNPNVKTKIRADVSEYGLGAVLLQYHEGEDWKPIACASEFQVNDRDRETLLAYRKRGLVWACEKFGAYVIGKNQFKALCRETVHGCLSTHPQ